MGTHTRRAISLLLATAVMLLTACGGTNNGGTNTPTAAPEFVYIAEYSPLPEETL